jgi:hypothetical protein
LRNSQLRAALEERHVAHGATAPGRLRVFQDDLNARQELVGPMRFADGPSETGGEHAVDPFLRLGKEAGAEENDDTRIDGAETAERFFAIHERHRKIEQNQIERIRSVPELFQAFEPGLDRRYVEPGFREDAVGQNARRRFVINYEDPSRPVLQGMAVGLGAFGVVYLAELGIVLHLFQTAIA